MQGRTWGGVSCVNDDVLLIRIQSQLKKKKKKSGYKVKRKMEDAFLELVNLHTKGAQYFRTTSILFIFHLSYFITDSPIW